jgi:uncharacterized membrane-anchored protein
MLLFDHYIVKVAVRAKLNRMLQKERKNLDPSTMYQTMGKAKVGTIDVDNTLILEIFPF